MNVPTKINPAESEGHDVPARRSLSKERGIQVLKWTVHLLLAATLIVIVAIQYLRNGITDDPDPDGYVTYADHLQEHGTLLPGIRRMPGYSVFLIVSSHLLGTDYHHAYYRVQLVILLLAVAAGYIWILRRLDAVTALSFLALLAAPSFLVTQASYMLCDFLYAVLVLPTIYWIYRWLVYSRGPRSYLVLPVIAVVVYLLYAIRPTTSVFLVMFLVSLGIAFALRWLRRRDTVTRKQFLAFVCRTSACVFVVAAASGLADRTLDSGARAYNLWALKCRIIYTLPAAGDSEDDRAIDAFRDRASKEKGQPLESTFYRLLPYGPETPHVNSGWLPRLKAHPIAYLGTIWDTMRWTHYLLLRHVAPFSADTSFGFDYPALADSRESRVFRATGFPIGEGIAIVSAKFLATWLLIGVGLWRLSRIEPMLVLALSLHAFLFWVFLCAVVAPEGRYMLPFAFPICIAEAAGVATLLQSAARRCARFLPQRLIVATHEGT